MTAIRTVPDCDAPAPAPTDRAAADGSAAGSGGPIRAVTVLSTGTVDIRPQQAFGSRLPTLAWLLVARRWLPSRPINVYVIEHEQGLVLFDTGQDRAVLTDPAYFPAGPLRLLHHRLARFRIRPQNTLTAQLAARGYRPEDVRLAVLSHLHVDHIGGLRDLPTAEVVVAEDELAELRRPLPEWRGLLRRHIDLPGLRWRPIRFAPTDDPSFAPFDRAYDLLGDGSLVLLPTPGHTPGSASLLVRRDGAAPLLLVGDLTYGVDLFEHGRVPGTGHRRQLRASSALVRQLRARLPDLAILPAHDPSAAARLAGRVPPWPSGGDARGAPVVVLDGEPFGTRQ
jgi:N-acyl homoserine lactone hydrolase